MTGRDQAPPPSISIIVPAFQETGLARIFDTFSCAPGVEIIFALAEGDSITQPPAEAKSTTSPTGRARQMNTAAAVAMGDILIFLHADTVIEPASLEQVRAALAMPGVAAGAFTLRVQGSGWWFRFITAVANFRSRLLKMPFGDQAIFLTRRLFERMGGFENTPILEDVLLIEKAKKYGRIVLIPAVASTSSRRWEARGRYKTTLRHWGIMTAHTLGASPHKIARWFER